MFSDVTTDFEVSGKRTKPHYKFKFDPFSETLIIHRVLEDLIFFRIKEYECSSSDESAPLNLNNTLELKFLQQITPELMEMNFEPFIVKNGRKNGAPLFLIPGIEGLANLFEILCKNLNATSVCFQFPSKCEMQNSDRFAQDIFKVFKLIAFSIIRLFSIYCSSCLNSF